MNVPPSSEPEVTETVTRVLYSTPLVHVYAIPPLQSNRGHVASVWTSSPQNEIFTCGVRIVETSNSSDISAPSPLLKPPLKTEAVTIDILLEDPNSSELFAGAPYTHASVVEPTTDSSRFFAVRVTGEGGRKAVLGLGFEERSDALDFSITLQDARKILGLEATTPSTPSTPSSSVTPRTTGLSGARNARSAPIRSRPDPVVVEDKSQPIKRDWSLKEGQMLHVEIGGKGVGDKSTDVKATIEPPSGGGLAVVTGEGFALLAPPPSAKEVKAEQRRDHDEQPKQPTLEELGFDDGEFGEFQ